MSPQETAKLTVGIPQEDMEFAKRYAKAHGITVTEVIDRHLRHLRILEQTPIDIEVEKLAGLLPLDIDAEEAYREHLANRRLS